MHREAYEYVKRTVSGLPVRDSVLEIGSYNVNGTIRDLFPGVAYTGIDRRAGRGVDVVADGADYAPPKPVDTVVTCEALEHAANAGAIIINAYRSLVMGGVLILTAAGPGRKPHGNDGGLVGAEYYRAVSRELLTEWLESAGFKAFDIEENPEAGDIYATAIKGKHLEVKP